jgi:hypothetical protein
MYCIPNHPIPPVRQEECGVKAAGGCCLREGWEARAYGSQYSPLISGVPFVSTRPSSAICFIWAKTERAAAG